MEKVYLSLSVQAAQTIIEALASKIDSAEALAEYMQAEKEDASHE